MANRIIQIEIKGEGGQYEATVNRIIEKNNQLNRSAIQGAQQMERVFINLQNNVLGGLARQFAATFAVGSVTAFFSSVLKGVADLQDLSDQTGILATNLAQLRQAGIASGQGIDEIATSIVRLQRNFIEAREKGAGPVFEALQRLGISGKELSAALADPNKLIELVTSRLGAMENVALRNATAMDLAGRSGGRLGTTLVELANNQEKYRQSSVLTNEQIKIVDDGLDKLAQTWQKVKDSTAAAVVELAKWIGLIERSKTEQINEQIKRNGDALRIQTQNLKQLQDQLDKGLVEDRHRPALEASRDAARKQIFELLDEQEKLNKALNEANKPPTAAGGPGPTGPSDDAKKRAQQAAEAIAKLNIEQAKLNITNLEAARASGRLSESQLAQGLTVGNLDDAIRKANLALIEQEKKAALSAAAHDKILTPALKAAIEEQARGKVASFEAAEAARRHKDILELEKRAAEGDAEAIKNLADVREAEARDLLLINQQKLDQLELTRQLGDEQANYLTIIGKTNDAEAARLTNLIEYLEQLKKLEAAQGKDTAALRTQQIQNAQTELERLGTITVDIGQHIGDTLENIFTSVISGTLKSVDVGKAALATVGNITTDIFRQAIKNKLSFEVDIFNNMRGLPGQMNQAFSAGAATLQGGASVGPLPGGGGGGFSFGGILDFVGNLFGGGGSGGGGGFLSSISSLFGGGSGGGGFGLGSMLGGLFSGGSQIGFGSANGLIGPSMANGGFFSNPLGAFMQGGASMSNGLIGGAVGLFTAGVTGGFKKSKIGSTIGSTIGGAIGSIWGPIGTLIGSTLGNLVGSLFNSTPDPSVWVKTVTKFYYDALTTSFNAFNEATIVRFRDIGGGRARETLAEHQQIMDTVSKQFTDILNTFPVAVHDSIVPFLDQANSVLDTLLGRKKYSEGGSRSIERELQDLREKEAPAAFFLGLRQAIGVGLSESLRLAGFDLSGVIGQAFAGPPENPSWRRGLDFGAGIAPPDNPEDMDRFLGALQQLASFTGGLSGISPRGIQPFLTDLDNQRLQAELERVFNASGSAFAPAVEDMLERVKPLSDFLAQSVGEASELFGRGMIAALEAATASDANRLFQESLGVGIKDKIFAGITESFIASAQFTDLLAPIQQTIRDFTQQAIATGQTPDLEAFRRALFPAIEDITTRGATLAPLIEELQRLGFDIRGMLNLLPPPEPATPVPQAPVSININIAEFSGSDASVSSLAHRLDNALRSVLPPG